MRSQFVTASAMQKGIRSQIATASKRNIRYRPYAFTEHGVIMAASILNSQRAVDVSVYVVRVFVKRVGLKHSKDNMNITSEELRKAINGEITFRWRADGTVLPLKLNVKGKELFEQFIQQGFGIKKGTTNAYTVYSAWCSIEKHPLCQYK